MTLLLKQIFAFIKLLNSETGTNQIAAGIACGFILGMTPALSLQSLIVFIFLLIFRIQIGAAFISAFFFSFIAYLLDPLFHMTGTFFLELPSLQGLFTKLYNMPIIPYTRFNNTIVLGSGIISFALFPVIFFSSRWFVKKYRELIVQKIKNTKAWKAVQATTLYKWYYKYKELYG
ncbi:MAG: TIGR03546 family protein [Bdellovibrio sp.]|nr:MAG: TIGR03546 family protein [Bdellovibrio sp.]